MASYPSPEPMTALWWLHKLEVELYSRRDKMLLMDAYYTGDGIPLPFLTKAHETKYSDEFRQLLNDCRANMMALVVEAVTERLRVDGFRLSATTDPTTDAPSWQIWQSSNMDANSAIAFEEAIVKGVSYLSVWPAEDGGVPTIAVEDPTETIVGYVPGSNFKKRAAALKLWKDDWTGLLRANVYMPEGIYKFQAKDNRTAQTGSYAVATARRLSYTRWEPVDTGDDFVENPIGIVPIVPLRNRPRLLKEGESDLCDLTPIQNQINATLFLKAMASYFSAHKQRWMVGGTIARDANGKAVEPFDVAADTLWHDEDPEVKFGEFSQTDLKGYIDSIKQFIDIIAIKTRIPRHYLEQSGQAPSGDSIKSAEAGLVRRVEGKQGHFGEALEETLSLALQFTGEAAPPSDSQIVWADASTESEAVRTDATIKQFAEGVIPWEAALEKLGYTMTEIQRYSEMRVKDAALAKQIAEAQPLIPAKNTATVRVVR